MRRHKSIALGTTAVLLAGAGAIVSGGLWSAQGTAPSDGGASQRGWPASSQSPAAAVNAAQASAERDGAQVLTFREVEDRSRGVDVGRPGDSPGDYFLFESSLKSRDGTQRLGRDSGRCMLVIRTFTCDATAKIFGKGKITVSGAFFNEADSRIAITGGTGAYKEAGGQLTVTDTSGGNTLLVFQVTD